MKKILIRTALLAFMTLTAGRLPAQVPQLISYQGRVGVDGVNFDGAGQFKFAFVNAAGTTTYWSNDGSSTAGSEPGTAITIPVSKGLYAVLLGDATLAHMSIVPATVFTHGDVHLRVWFSDGVNGFQKLTPDRRIAAVGYAMMADSVSDGAITTAKIADGAVTSAKLAAGVVQTANLATGAVGNTQLANSAVTINAGTGLGGGGLVSLGGNVTLSNAGVLSLTGGGGISVDAGTGAITLGSSATSVGTAGAIVARDASGGFTAGTITAALNGNATTATSATSFTGPLAGDVTGTQAATTIADATVTGKVLTGFTSASGTLTASDTLLSAISKLDGNVTLKAPLASPTFTGSVTLPVGSATAAPLLLQTGPPLTTPALGAVEFDGTNLFVTNNSASPTRKTVAFTDTTIAAAQIPDATITSAKLTSNLTLGGTTSGTFSGNLTGNVTGNVSGSAASFTGSLTGDVTGTQAATVVSTVGGVTSTSLAAGATLANAATHANTASTLVRRDASGNFSAGTITAALNGNASTATDFTGMLAGDVTGSQAATVIPASTITGKVITGFASTAGTLTASDSLLTAINKLDGNVALKAPLASPTFTGSVTLPAGSATAAPLLLQTGTNLTSPALGAFEFDGTNVFVTNNSVTPTRKTVAFTDSSISASQIANGTITSAMIANGAVGSSQLAANAVQSGNIATGAIGSLQLADGAITAAKIADASITPDKLAKPLRTGSVSSSSLAIDPIGASITVPFTPAFGTVPNITLTMDAGEGSVPSKAHVALTGRTTTQFTAIVSNSMNSALTNFTEVTVDAGRTSPNAIGKYSAMMIVNGRPAISYQDGANGDLKYVRSTDANGDAWDAPVTIDAQGEVGAYTSLQVVNGNPAVSYYDATNGRLKFVRANDVNGSSWSDPINVDSSANVGAFSSLAVVNGYPAIAYHDVSNTDLKFVRANDANGSTWGTPTAQGSAYSVGEYCSLAVVNGNPAIAYYDATNANLMFVRAANASGTGTWLVGVQYTIDSAGQVGQAVRLAVVNGRPAVSYWYGTGDDLKYAIADNANGTTWSTRFTVDSIGSVGGESALAVVNGNPAIAYSGNSEFRFVRANDIDGFSWGSPVTISTPSSGAGSGVSLMVANGLPIVSSHDVIANGLRVIRAADNLGANWGKPVIVDGKVQVGMSASMSIISGNPAISYYDSTSQDLKYVRSNNISGTTWSSPVTLDFTGVVGVFNSLAVIGGKPAISYYDETNSAIKFIKSNDATGASWSLPVIVNSNGTSGQYCCLAEVNGKAAMCYFEGTTNTVQYIISDDTDPTGWSSPIIVGNGSNYQTSLVVINGNPAVSFTNSNTMKYARANDAEGTTWGNVVSVTPGLAGSLSLVNGTPCIVYQDSQNSDFKFVKALDPNGESWGTPVVAAEYDGSGQDGVPSISLINGSPAVFGRSYYSRSIDSGGLVWSDRVSFRASNYRYDSGSKALALVEGKPAAVVTDGTSLIYVRAGSSLPFSILWMAVEP
jgi:hypothetical protein